MLDKALWLQFHQEKNTTEPVIKENALIFYKSMEIEGEFTAGEG